MIDGALILRGARLTALAASEGNVVLHLVAATADVGSDGPPHRARPVALVMLDGTARGVLARLPQGVAGSALRIHGKVVQDVLPLPLDLEAELELELSFEDGSELRVLGRRLSVCGASGAG